MDEYLFAYLLTAVGRKTKISNKKGKTVYYIVSIDKCRTSSAEKE